MPVKMIRANHRNNGSVDVVELIETDSLNSHTSLLILKAYPSPDGKKIRIVLPELKSGTQISGKPGYPTMIEFTREEF